jgi:hypothetical protein
MIAAGSIEFALARMQARLARRPSEAAWASIEESRGIAPILDAARVTTLGPLVMALPPAPDLRAVDKAARMAWSRTVRNAALWMPPQWTSAIDWCDSAPRHDEDCRANPTLLPTLGHADWRKRWPDEARDDPDLGALAHLFTLHLARFRKAAPHEAAGLRRRFEERLLAVMRRHPMQPVAAFAWLAICALDLERLRGEIERRIAFPEARIAA